MRRAAAFLGLAVLVGAGFLASGTARAASETRWLHIRVEERSGNGESVKVHLPLSMIQSMAPLLDDVDVDTGTLRFDDKDFDAAELRKVMEEVRKAPDAEFVTIDSEESHLRFAKSG